MQAVPFVSFPGCAEEALNFYKTAFGGDIACLDRYDNAPGDDIPPESRNKIAHARFVIDGDARFDVDDCLEPLSTRQDTIPRFSILLLTKSEAQGRDFHVKLSEGGQVIRPMEKVYWNAIYGQVIDRFGVRWDINFTLPSG
jgi:PhnB protein